MKKIILIIYIFLFAFSCEDYLKDELLSDISADYVFNTAEGLEGGVNALYNLNRNYYDNGQWNNAMALLLPAKSDLSFGRAGEAAFFARLGWGASINDTGTRLLYSDLWRHYYRLADRSNAIIEGAEALNNIEESRRIQIIAEAKVHRAHTYFTLYRLFNNIFVTTAPTTPDNAFDVPSSPSTEAEIFDLINSDLEYAIENLAWTTEEFGRFTQATARHIKAKAAMWQQDYQEAKLQAEAIINSGHYSLVPSTKAVFEGDMNHSESLFVVQYEDGVIGGSNRNQIHFNLMANYNLIDGAKYSNENGGRGGALLLPNMYLVDLLREDPNDDRDDNTYMISYYLYNDAENLPEGRQIGDTIAVYQQDSPNADNHRLWYQRQNPGVLKYFQEDGIASEVSSITNIMVYRLAETYLIAAEANMYLGNTAMALDQLNTVRARAKAAPKLNIDLQTVLDERARELFFEGQRFFTLKRTNRLVPQTAQYAGNDNWHKQARERIMDYMKNLPIPETELNLLGPGYPQNEGY
ncbi:RagB/SusD family nutrient uptake outer membrane protein [Roseivirga pacifica]